MWGKGELGPHLGVESTTPDVDMLCLGHQRNWKSDVRCVWTEVGGGQI